MPIIERGRVFVDVAMLLQDKVMQILGGASATESAKKIKKIQNLLQPKLKFVLLVLEGEHGRNVGRN